MSARVSAQSVRRSQFTSVSWFSLVKRVVDLLDTKNSCQNLTAISLKYKYFMQINDLSWPVFLFFNRIFKRKTLYFFKRQRRSTYNYRVFWRIVLIFLLSSKKCNWLWYLAICEFLLYGIISLPVKLSR